MKKPVKDMIASVRERLRQLSIRQKVEFQQLLNRYAIERVLYRLLRPEIQAPRKSLVVRFGAGFTTQGQATLEGGFLIPVKPTDSRRTDVCQE